jgi:hypothetical protein
MAGVNASVDDSVYVYVSRPGFTFTYAGMDRFYNEGPAAIAAPVDAVFVTFVSFSKPVVDDVQETFAVAEDSIGGAILYWEWTMASSVVPYQTRYRRPVWFERRNAWWRSSTRLGRCTFQGVRGVRVLL